MYQLTLNEQEMQVLNQALGELPFRLAAPLINSINQQIVAQRTPNGRAEPEAAAETEKLQ